MSNKLKNLAVLVAVLIFTIGTFTSHAAISEKASKESKSKQDKLLRASAGVFDLQKNTVSNIEFYVTNYGIFGFDVTGGGGQGGGYWPRGSLNQYIFGGGIWFGARKVVQNDTVPLVLVTYNPNSGDSWMVPGRINLGGPGSTEFENVMEYDPNETKKFRSYFSTDFNASTGAPFVESDGPNWPIWDSSDRDEDTLKSNRYYGQYIDDINRRNRNVFSKGPAFISGEDIFSTYKDTDLAIYEGGQEKRRNEGYPLMLQFEEMIYSWGFGKYKDFIFIKYEITNYSSDTLYDCWMAPVMDVDLARAPSLQTGASNDRTRFYLEDPSLNLAYQWTDNNRGEAGKGFGYLGFDFLESPAVFQAYDTIPISDDSVYLKPKYDSLNGFIRNDKKVFTNEEQLGLVSFRNWVIEDDLQENNERYQFISEAKLDDDNGPGDKRFMMSTGPFNMRPTDTARVVVGIIIANSSKGGDADGTVADAQGLISLDKFAQEVYDNNFRAPVPPDRTNFIDWKPLNNAVEIQWDSTSEFTDDIDERGLDFLGYRLYRARRTDLDTFSINNISGGGNYPLGKGPLGWKQVAEWRIPTAFTKSTRRAALDENANTDIPFIDSLVIVGPYIDDLSGQILDSMAIRCWRVPRGATVHFTSDTAYFNNFLAPPSADSIYTSKPYLTSLDTTYFQKPWGSYYGDMAMNDGLRIGSQLLYDYDAIKRTDLHDDVMEVIIYLNKGLFKYNPLLMRPILANVSREYLDSIIKLSYFSDGIVGPTRIDSAYNKDSVMVRDTVRIGIDTVYFRNTVRHENINGQLLSIVEAMVPNDKNQIMKDTTGYVRSLLDSVYYYIQSGNLIEKVEFNDFVADSSVKENIIAPFIREITDGRRFIDIGDDNRNQLVEENQDPMITEKLINNMDYYYKMLAFDEGDWAANTELKENTGILREEEGDNNYMNIVRTSPHASGVGKESIFEIIHVDSNKIGGLYDFEFFGLDPERVEQDFAGHTLELEFQPYWSLTSLLLSSDPTAAPLSFGLYRSLVTLTDLNTGEILFEDILSYEAQACQYRYTELFSENGASVVLTYPSDEKIDSLVTPPDTITFQLYNNTEMISKAGEFSTGDFTQLGYCYSSSVYPPAYGTIGFRFNFAMEQYGGALRQELPTSTYKAEDEDAVTPISIVNANYQPIAKDYRPTALPDLNTTRLTQYVGVDWNTNSYMFGSFNNGPGEYEIEFLPGGEERVTMTWDGKTNEFIIPYLNVKVTNIKEFARPNPGTDSMKVMYPGEMEHMVLNPTDAPSYESDGMYIQQVGRGIFSQIVPDPINLAFDEEGLIDTNSAWVPKTVGSSNLGRQPYKLSTNEFIGKYNLSAYAYANARNVSSFNFNKTFTAVAEDSEFRLMKSPYSGLEQGRYYLSAKSVDGNDQIDFANVVNIGGLPFVFNYANVPRLNWDIKMTSGNNATYPTQLQQVTGYEYGADFESGDVVTLKSTGGAFGMPLPGAKVRVKIGEHKPENQDYSDGMMDDVLVVPNPYYVSHQGEKSPYDSKIYFTKLPERCTINIYTLTGDLVQTLEHDEFTASEPGKAAVEVWNLLTDNNQRVQSQTLIAHISTPNGAETVKPFTIVVGGFRIIND